MEPDSIQFTCIYIVLIHIKNLCHDTQHMETVYGEVVTEERHNIPKSAHCDSGKENTSFKGGRNTKKGKSRLIECSGWFWFSCYDTEKVYTMTWKDTINEIVDIWD